MESISSVTVILLGYLNAVFVLAGVALGGFLVYRTKREPHEGLFKPPGDPGSSVVAGEGEDAAIEEPSTGMNDDDELGFGADVMQRNRDFMQQFGQEHPTFIQRDSSASGEEPDKT